MRMLDDIAAAALGVSLTLVVMTLVVIRSAVKTSCERFAGQLAVRVGLPRTLMACSYANAPQSSRPGWLADCKTLAIRN